MQASRVLLFMFIFGIVLNLLIRSVEAPSPFHENFKKGPLQLTTPLLQDMSIYHKRPSPKKVVDYTSNPRENRDTENAFERQAILRAKHEAPRPFDSKTYQPPKWNDVKGN